MVIYEMLYGETPFTDGTIYLSLHKHKQIFIKVVQTAEEGHRTLAYVACRSSFWFSGGSL